MEKIIFTESVRFKSVRALPGTYYNVIILLLVVTVVQVEDPSSLSFTLGTRSVLNLGFLKEFGILACIFEIS